MFWPLRPVDGITKPPPGALIDAAHPLAPFTCWLLNETTGKSLYEATGKNTLFRESPTFLATPTRLNGTLSGGYGTALNFVSASQQGIEMQFPNAIFPVTNNGQATLSVLYRTTSAGTNLCPYSQTQLGAATPRRLYILVNSGAAGSIAGFLRADNASTSLTANVAVSGNDGQWHWIHLVNEGGAGNLRLYFDGVQRAVTANVCTGSVTVTAEDLGSASGASLYYSGDVSLAASFAKALSPQEIKSHIADPFQMFLSQRPLQPTLLPSTAVIDRRTANPRSASRGARGGL